MNKLLKQLVHVLDEEGIQIEKIDFEDNIPGETRIEINKEIAIVDRGGNYALYAEDASVDKTYYICLRKALEVLADYLSKVKEGAILESGNGKYTYRVIKHQMHDKYNLLDLDTDRLLYFQHVSLNLIQDQINEGVFYVK